MELIAGDRVEMELSSSSEIKIRYDYDITGCKWIDTGGSGVFVSGLVEKVDGGFAILAFIQHNLYFNIPLPGNQYYVAGQFDLPGFVRLIVDSNKCICGSDKTYGLGTPFHSSWCGKYKTNPYTEK